MASASSPCVLRPLDGMCVVAPGQVGSLLKEPRLAVFYSPPQSDLHLRSDEDHHEDEEVSVWPDTQHLFGEDPEYQGLISEIMEYTGNTVDRVLDYIKVRLQLALILTAL